MTDTPFEELLRDLASRPLIRQAVAEPKPDDPPLIAFLTNFINSTTNQSNPIHHEQQQ